MAPRDYGVPDRTSPDDWSGGMLCYCYRVRLANGQRGTLTIRAETEATIANVITNLVVNGAEVLSVARRERDYPAGYASHSAHIRP
jgi:hypothetical protein